MATCWPQARLTWDGGLVYPGGVEGGGEGARQGELVWTQINNNITLGQSGAGQAWLEQGQLSRQSSKISFRQKVKLKQSVSSSLYYTWFWSVCRGLLVRFSLQIILTLNIDFKYFGLEKPRFHLLLFDRLLDCSFLCAVKFILLREASDGGPGKIRFIIFCKRDSFMSVLTKTERKQSWEGKNRIRP